MPYNSSKTEKSFLNLNESIVSIYFLDGKLCICKFAEVLSPEK